MTKNENERNVPELRFQGFTDAWEKRKFTDVARRINQQAMSSKLPAVEYEDVIPESGHLNKDVSRKKILKKGVVFTDGDVLFGKLRPYLKNWLLADFSGIAVGDFWVLRPVQTNSCFLYFFIQSTSFQIVANQSSGTKMPRSDWNKVSETVFRVPTYDEQIAIGRLVSGIDATIALHQRKHELLLKLKQGYLQKLFPKNDEIEPELRFAGFTDAWEKRKLGQLGSVAMNKRIFKEQTAPVGEIPFYKIGTFGGVPDSFISRNLFEEYKQKYPYPQPGDLLISASGSIGRIVEYAGKDEYFQDSNIVWLQHDDRLSNLFLKQYYGIVRWKGLEGSTIKRLYNKNILETTINLPTVKEQVAIGHFLQQLDQTIALHQRKLDELKKLKQAYLQKMFV
jgi:type I restriction enzyme S subunit